MKTFALVLLMAGFAAAKELPPTEPAAEEPKYDKDGKPIVDPEAPADGDEGLEPDLTPEEQAKIYWQNLTDEMLLARMTWQGVYSGLYGIAGEDEAPKDDCFGDWIPEKMKEVGAARNKVKDMSMTFEDAATAAYDIVDLIFLNDKYCHFRKVMWDLHDFCKYGDTCGSDMVFDNMQKNAFNIITQVSSSASIFKQTKWADMDAEHKGYTANQMGHSLAGLVADLIAFDPENIPLPPPPAPEPTEEDAEEQDDEKKESTDDAKVE